MLRRAGRRNMFWCQGLSLIEKCNFISKLFLVHFTKGIDPRLLPFTLSCFLLLFFKWRQGKEECKVITKDKWPAASVETHEVFWAAVSVIRCSHCSSLTRQVVWKEIKSLYILLSERLLNVINSNGKKGVLDELSYFHCMHSITKCM